LASGVRADEGGEDDDFLEEVEAGDAGGGEHGATHGGGTVGRVVEGGGGARVTRSGIPMRRKRWMRCQEMDRTRGGGGEGGGEGGGGGRGGGAGEGGEGGEEVAAVVDLVGGGQGRLVPAVAVIVRGSWSIEL
ncbi:hypothetical protein CLOM_g15299, partial [Closterium sp. NIES-68]